MGYGEWWLSSRQRKQHRQRLEPERCSGRQLEHKLGYEECQKLKLKLKRQIGIQM